MPSDAATSSVAGVPTGDAADAAAVAVEIPPVAAAQSNPVQPFDLRKPSLLTAGELRRLGFRHDEFARSVATRLSIHLRLEIGVQVAGLDSCYYPQLTERWANPTQIALFKVDGLDGVGLFEISPRLGISLVERLLGGSGKAAALSRDLTEIEVALLDQVVSLVLKEWCDGVTMRPGSNASIIGHETNPHFLQTASNDTSILVLALEFRFHDLIEKAQLALPYPMLQPVIRQLNPPMEVKKPATPAQSTPVKWNPGLDSVRVPLSVEWCGLEVEARKLAHLKVGDVLPVASELVNQAKVRLSSVPKFTGRLGQVGNLWAVELTEKL